MAVKIVRQANKIVLLGSPTSAAAMSPGREGAPAALRSAGLAERLRSAGYEVEDAGDDPVQTSRPDESSPRARNIQGVLASLSALKPRVEVAIKSGGLPLILSGDCSVALATVAGARRYFRNVSVLYVDRDADLNTPATTTSGSLDSMVVSHLTGRGTAELVRFWSEPPLVRDPDVALFGVVRLDPAEREILQRSTLRSYPADEVRRMGAAPAAQTALERIHGDKGEFVLHVDVDTIEDFAATDDPGEGGLRLEEIREALEVFARQTRLAAIDVAGYDPAKDPDGSGARIVVDLIVDVLTKRLNSISSAAASAEAQPTGKKAEPKENEKTPSGPALAPDASRSVAAIAQTPPDESWPSESAAEKEDSEVDASSGDSNAGHSAEDERKDSGS